MAQNDGQRSGHLYRLSKMEEWCEGEYMNEDIRKGLLPWHDISYVFRLLKCFRIESTIK